MSRIKRYYNALILLGFILLSFLLYGNTIHGQFVLDDSFFHDRSELRSISYIPRLFSESMLPDNPAASAYRPLTYATFVANFAIFGESPVSFHIVSILLNGVVCFLVYLVAFRLCKDRKLAIFTALIFACFPIHTEAIANIKSRDELLSSIFALISWHFFLNYEKNVKKYTALYVSGVFFLFALLSKEFSVVIPGIFILTSLLQKKIKNQDLARIVLVFGGIFLLYMLMRYNALTSYTLKGEVQFISNPLIEATWIESMLTPFKILFMYVSKTIFPIGLSASYHFNQISLEHQIFSLPVLGGIAFFLCFVAVYLWKRLHHLPLMLGVVIFFVSYAPFSQFLFKGGDIFAERWMYFPSIGIALILAWIVNSLYKIQPITFLSSLIIVLFFFSTTIITRNKVWLTNETLFESMIVTSPDSVKGYSILGYSYLEKGDILKAQKLAEHGFTITDKYAPLYDLLAGVEFAQGDATKAADLLYRSQEIDPDYLESFLDLVLVLASQEKYDQAFQVIQEKKLVGVHLPSTFSDSQKYMFAYVFAKTGHHKESIALIASDLRSLMGTPQLKFLLAVNYYKLGHFDESKRYADWDQTLSEKDKLILLKEF